MDHKQVAIVHPSSWLFFSPFFVSLFVMTSWLVLSLLAVSIVHAAHPLARKSIPNQPPKGSLERMQRFNTTKVIQ
jgi:hypothetical protein